MHNLLGAAFSFFLLGTSVAQNLVGVSYTGTIHRLDAASGTGTVLGTTGFSGAGGLARIHDVLYTNDLAGRLWTIDPWSGAVAGGAQTTPALNSIRAMAVSRVGTLFVVQNGGGQIGTSLDLLYVVEPRTGAATLVGTMSHNGIQALAFAPDDTLYGWDTTVGLVTVSPTTAVSADVNAAVAATASIQALTFGANGVLYGARNELYSISRSTGVTTLIGSGGYTDLRGVEYVHGPRIYDNGPFITHPGGGFGGADLSMVQTSLGLQVGAWVLDWSQGYMVFDDFTTNGPVVVDAIDVFVTGNAPLNLTNMRLAIYDGDPSAGGQLVQGSPTMQMNLLQQPGWLVAVDDLGAFRALETLPLSTALPLNRIRVQFGQPLPLFSAALPTGRYWLRFSASTPQPGGLAVLPVTTQGVRATGNARWVNFGSTVSLNDGPYTQGLPFALYGQSIAPPGAITNLGGGCSGANSSLSVRGAHVAGGTMVHELSGASGFPAIVIGFADPSLGFAPSCGCVLHTSFDFVALLVNRYDLIAPPGVGTGFDYRVQGMQLDLSGTSSLPCNAGLGFGFRLTDAYRVRFW